MLKSLKFQSWVVSTFLCVFFSYYRFLQTRVWVPCLNMSLMFDSRYYHNFLLTLRTAYSFSLSITHILMQPFCETPEYALVRGLNSKRRLLFDRLLPRFIYLKFINFKLIKTKRFICLFQVWCSPTVSLQTVIL